MSGRIGNQRKCTLCLTTALLPVAVNKDLIYNFCTVDSVQSEQVCSKLFHENINFYDFFLNWTIPLEMPSGLLASSEIFFLHRKIKIQYKVNELLFEFIGSMVFNTSISRL